MLPSRSLVRLWLVQMWQGQKRREDIVRDLDQIADLYPEDIGDIREMINAEKNSGFVFHGGERSMAEDQEQNFRNFWAQRRLAA